MPPPVLVVHLQGLLLPATLVDELAGRLLAAAAVAALAGLGRSRGRGRVARRQDVLGEAAEKVARGIVIGHHVDLAVAVAGHADAELGAVAPDYLGEVARLQGRRLLAVHVLRLLGVPVDSLLSEIIYTGSRFKEILENYC